MKTKPQTKLTPNARRLRTLAERYDFQGLYKLSETDLEHRIMAMGDAEYAAFSEWHDARTRYVFRKAREQLPSHVHAELSKSDARNGKPCLSRIDQTVVSKGMLNVLDYLSGHHPLLCSSPEERDDLATTRDAADIIMEIMADIGVKDRHEAAMVLESILASQNPRHEAARKSNARTHRSKP